MRNLLKLDNYLVGEIVGKSENHPIIFRVDRTGFLIKELSNHVSEEKINQVVKSNTIEAGIDYNIIIMWVIRGILRAIRALSIPFSILRR